MVEADRSIGPEPAIRLICRADDNEVQVIRSRRLTKIVPPSEPIGDDDLHGRPRSGFWIEVRDDQERSRYRRVIADPLAGEVEVPGDGGSFTRRPVTLEGVTFALLIPDIQGADHVSLLRGPAVGPAARRAGRLAERTGEIARLPLR